MRTPPTNDLAGSDFASNEVNESILRQLHCGEFIDGTHNFVLIGRAGTDKTHVAIALGVRAIKHYRKKVRFCGTADLVNGVERERAMNKAGQLAERLPHLDLVILNEFGYLPFSLSCGVFLFHRLSKFTECASIVITTKLRFSEWADVLDDAKMATALLDRPVLLLYPLDWKGQLPVQGQLGGHAQNTKEEITGLTANPDYWTHS